MVQEQQSCHGTGDEKGGHQAEQNMGSQVGSEAARARLQHGDNIRSDRHMLPPVVS